MKDQTVRALERLLGRSPAPAQHRPAPAAERVASIAAQLRRGMPLDRVRTQPEALGLLLGDVLDELRDLQDLAALAPVAPSPEQLWAHVRTSEQGRKARELGKALGRASRTIAEQRGVIARLRERDRRTVEDAERWGDEIGQRDREATLATGARVVRNHALEPGAGITCLCGWGGMTPFPTLTEYSLHVAAQLAAVGALGPLTTPQPAPRPTPRTGSFATTIQDGADQ